MNHHPVSQSGFRLRIAEQFADERTAHDCQEDDLTAVAEKFKACEGVVFDMGDVLFDATCSRRRLLQILRRMGMHAAYRSFFSLWDRDYLDAVHRGERDYGEAFLSFLRDAGLSAGQVDEVIASSVLLKRQIEAETRLFPDVRETLESLHARGLRLGVLSDSESSAATILKRLHGFGVGGYFSTVVSSVELRNTKPHRHCYLTALERLGVAANRAVFVGHDAEELAGARRCGMRTVAFNYDREASADCRISRFRDLGLLFTGRNDDGLSLSKAA